MTKDQRPVPPDFRYILEEWWNLLFSGPLWMVNIADLPNVGIEKIRYALLRNAAKRKRRVSVRFDMQYRYVLVQGGSLGDSMTTLRVPKTEYQRMVRPPMVIPEHRTEQPRQVNYDDIIERLMGEMDADPISPDKLRDHPTLSWMAQDCNCKTLNIRAHSLTCPAYLGLPLLEHSIKNSSQSPEQWYFTRYVGPYAVVQETGYRAPAQPQQVPSPIGEAVDAFLQDPATGVTRTRGQASRPVPEPVAEPAAVLEEEDPWTEQPVSEPEPEPAVTGPQVQFTQQPDPVASTPIAKPPVGPMVINWDGHPS